MKLRAAPLLPAQLPLSMCAIDACGGALSSCFQSSKSLLSPFPLLVSRAFFAASPPAALHALHPQNALLVAGPLTPRFFSPSSMRLCCVPCVWHPDLLSHPGPQDRFGRHVVTPDVIKGRTPVLPPTLIWQPHLVIPGVLEACYSHFVPQPSLHPCRVCDPGLAVFRYWSHTHSCAL